MRRLAAPFKSLSAVLALLTLVASSFLVTPRLAQAVPGETIPDLAGVWAYTETVTMSTCDGATKDEKRALLLVVNQHPAVHFGDPATATAPLEVQVVGQTSYSSLLGTVGLSWDYLLKGQSGASEATMEGKVLQNDGWRLTGTRTISALDAAEKTCVVLASFEARKL